MEDWEEDSYVESCRSSVISDLDELEANLYSLVHHEANEILNESSLYALSVLPIDEGCLKTPKNVSDITEQDITSGKHAELAEEKERNSEQEESEVKDQSNVKLDHSKNCDQDLLDELADSRYNIGCAIENGNGNIIPTSSVTATAEANSNSSPLPQRKCSSPVVIDISSSEEDLDVIPIKVVPLKKKPRTEEVIVIDDSDESDRIRTIIKTYKEKWKNFKTLPEILNDIELNTVKSSKVRRSDKMSDSHSYGLDNVQPMPVIPSVRSTPRREEPKLSSVCKSWTPQMIHFYEESWGGENLTLQEILFSMSDHGWHLDVTDEFSTLAGGQDRRYFGRSKVWCSNCSRKGHFRNECPEEARAQHCRRCGSTDHQEYRCHQKLCLTCGRNTKTYVTACHSCRSRIDKGRVCSICSLQGHPSSCCPDLWRRFHATIIPGNIVRPKKVLYKNSMNMYCCNCATRGHHVYQCKKKAYSDYIPCSPKVINYDDPSLLDKPDPRAISENWERMQRAENRTEETPRSRKREYDNPSILGKPDPRAIAENRVRSQRVENRIEETTRNRIREDDIRSILARPDRITVCNTLKLIQKLENIVNECREKEMELELEYEQRPDTPTENRNSKVIKLSKTETSSKESKISTSSVSTKVGPSKRKKKPKKPKEEKLPKNQSITNVTNTIYKSPPLKRGMPKEKLDDVTSVGGNSGEPQIKSLDHFPTKKSDKSMILSIKEYEMLKTKEGEEVLRFVTTNVAGCAVTVLPGKVKLLLFIGGNRPTTRAKKLIRTILRDKDYWNEIVERSGIRKNADDKGTSSKTEAASKSETYDDLRVEIVDPSSLNVRNVTCLPNFKPNHTQGQKNRCATKGKNSATKGKNKKNDQTQLWNDTDNREVSEAKQTIQSVARTLLKSKEFTAEKLKSFSTWALKEYGKFVNGSIRYHLHTLSKVNENGKPVEHFRKNLRTILKWPGMYKAM